MIIETNTELLTYIPNVFASAIGENPLLDKMRKFLDLAEIWMNINICDHATYGALVSQERASDVELVKRIVVNDAFHRAIPYLDLVLTPNGFGIVSNQNVAPASKERVASLRAQALVERDMAISQLITSLKGFSEWCNSVPGRKFGLTVIQNIDVAVECGEDSPSMSFWVKNQREIEGVQRMIALNFVSEPVMSRLCHNLLHNSVTEVERPLIGMIHGFIVASLKEEQQQHCELEEMVNYLKAHISDFPEWESSDTALLFNDYSFENTKEAKGFWF